MAINSKMTPKQLQDLMGAWYDVTGRKRNADELRGGFQYKDEKLRGHRGEGPPDWRNVTSRTIGAMASELLGKIAL